MAPKLMNQFDIPVVVFFFKRFEKTVLVIDRIAEVRPKKIYLISDGPRNEAERADVELCRRNVEAHVNWPCEVIKNYADVNKGVYDRIGLGAKWVLSQEESAIFLEDDNLPEVTFFRFCEEMLSRYKDDTRVLWICGTNYLKEYVPSDGSSYVFTKLMMPCGWASWGNKFLKFYEGDLSLWDDPYIKNRIIYENENKSLMRQDIECWDRERYRIRDLGRANSWDYQMSFTQRVHGLYAIVPKFNQIKNIGVDNDSIHGGNSFSNIMTSRFCGLPTKSIDFPLVHPKVVLSDKIFDRQVSNIILLPMRYRLKGLFNVIIKKIFFIDKNDSLTGKIRERFGNIFKL